ncbi:YbhB/YbcL family Raf kinase inhibitor-like protein [Nocardia sp. NEAU-G5]|uniref:YbhB/YbcL family Raf kinase inhibitor-like protein n=1 Tax=Nocardia albiluteola TaxID=2842303 RepID=A0ABS6B705_9NOCA|nr:YbhB/YbcL family Raf kinase inhibitor-like protein [Nocardia albiluteola]MBU3064964.1 YbhB/YbcL family Raf kinase inhibitor-like protein [Nocardia albiluteola]
MARNVIGRLLRPVRAGIGKTAWHHPATAAAPETITVTSNAFADGAPIPRRYAGAGVGDNIAPPLAWSGAPEAAAELVLIVEDPDVPLPRPIVHALLTGIDPGIGELREGAMNLPAPGSPSEPLAAHIGVGSFKRRGYAGPRPIPGHGPHRYIFQLFALDTPSGLADEATLPRTLTAMDGHVIARGRLTGTYQRD